jgi:hypothetical protein
VVFEITEEDSVFEVDRIIPDIAFVDHAQDFRPHRRVIAFVTFLAAGLKPDHHSKALHHYLYTLNPDLTVLRKTILSAYT